MIETKQLPSLDSLPDHIRLRIQRGSMLFADAHFCARYFDPPHDSAAFSLRVADLLRAGMTWADCQWLWMAGYLADVRARGAREQTNHRRRRPRLSEQARVMLTAGGEAEFRRFQFRRAASADRAKQNPRGQGNHEVAIIRYDDENRELYLGDVLVLRLRPSARNLHVLLKRFDDVLWKTQIPCPFDELTCGARAQAVRDVVHNLNKAQDPLRIVFRSVQKGAKIFYELADD